MISPLSIASLLAACVSSTDGDLSGADSGHALPGWTCDGSSLYGFAFNYRAADGWDASAAEDNCRVPLAEAVSLREGEAPGEDVVLGCALDAGEYFAYPAGLWFYGWEYDEDSAAESCATFFRGSPYAP